MTILRKAYYFIFYLLICSQFVLAQNNNPSTFEQLQMRAMQMEQTHPTAKATQRYEIDAKRMGVNVTDDDALPRSREFKRIDSSYYVGWMYEGAYKYNHAADYLGFKNASVSLQHAMDDLERDYKRQLATRTNDIVKFIAASKFQSDYSITAYFLANCYSNMEQPEKVFALLRHSLTWNFQRDYYLDIYNWMAWTVHRNRFYTSSKYSFLKNSIDANEKLANTYLDSQLAKIDRNASLNYPLWHGAEVAQDKLSVYHYKNIVYSYSFQIDSAQHYFDLMRGSSIFPHNNYANFRMVCGDFRTAEDEYKKAVMQDNGDKRLKEWAYYSSILYIYKALPKNGVELTRDMIKANGSTPGFGWYNIALARCMLYDGQSSEAERYIEKAAEFKELHIGTTLGQSQYDFSIQLIKLMNKLHAQEAQRFENKNWWYNPKVLAKMTQYTADKYLQQFLIINQFSQNPERDRVIYKLFSTESTVTWDEIYYLIRDFSTQFFLDKFKKEAETDPRKYIIKYFRYFVAKLEMKQGDYTEGKKMLDAILTSPEFDEDYEKLFVARLFQAEAECAKHDDKQSEYDDWMNKMYKMYPQLIPYTGLQMNMYLHVSGIADEKVVKRLKSCNINFVTNSSVPAPEAYLIFSQKGNRKSVEYYVLDKAGNTIVEHQIMGYNETDEDVGVQLAYRLFNIGGKAAPDKDNAALTDNMPL